ncbi:hypothetical protein BDV96DRAFT_334562 [Lophiotrema nucula]|uniref:Zn(2)-C6 fungal-type domain-containing protein n=1 Tax=Lophiotrema nucula TaxID=690887 RepID=A0A6A5YH15_9PLEO|nr:hypothetical protein BDV96DRAFT_334562 [Lophiotrema nucula]
MRVERQQRRACDRCHAVKEKCRWSDDKTTCERCHRLRSTCQISRPIATAGRKSRYHHAIAGARRESRSSSSESSLTASPDGSSNTSNTIAETTPPPLMHISTQPSIFTGLNDRELEFLQGIPQGRTRIDQFLVGPSFRACHQQTFLRQLCTATFIIQDAVIASSALIACEDELHTNHQDRAIGHKRAASAISALRSLGSFSSGDLSAILMLSASAVTFALHISGSALAICRHSLHLIQPFYSPTMDLDTDSLAFLVCLVHSETAECLLRCEVPTLRFEVPLRYTVDRFLGVAAPLLSHLHDICEISYNLSRATSVNNAETMRSLDEIGLAVDHWQPSLPNDFMTRFEPAEVASMLAQANVHRWSILLIAHRLCYPYGTETTKGTALSIAILTEVDSTVKLTTRSIPCIDIAYIVACFELTDTRERQLALTKTEVVVEFSRQLQSKIKLLLIDFWRIRDARKQLYWYSISSLLLP